MRTNASFLGSSELVRGVFVLCVAVACVAGGARAQGVPLTASPDTVSFSNMEDVATVRLMYGDAPLASEAVRSARIMIDNRDYSGQFVITRSTSGPAIVTIRPNPETAQVGSFSLRIGTASGEVKVPVLTPFDALPGMLENQAKAQGMTVEQLKAKLGMTRAFDRNTLSVGLPESFIEGYAFNVTLPNGNDHEYVWTVDGAVVLQGAGKSALSHVFDKPGDHVISVEEKKGQGIVASWEGVLKVVAQTPMKWTVPAKTAVTVPGPEGFGKYTWQVDGKDVSTARELTYTFASKGKATITCVATEPERGNPAEFRKFTWETVVK